MKNQVVFNNISSLPLHLSKIGTLNKTISLENVSRYFWKLIGILVLFVISSAQVKHTIKLVYDFLSGTKY